MQAIKAIYDGVSFMPRQPIPVKGKYEVVITFIEPIKENSTTIISQSAKLPRSTGKGLWKGQILLSDDFDDPLEELKEYME